MAYENVNVASARQAINGMISGLNCSESSNIVNRLSTDSFWKADSKKVLSNALGILVNDRYGDIRSTLEKYNKILDKIEEYKSIQTDYNSKSQSLSNMKNQYDRLKYNDKQFSNSKKSNTSAAISNKREMQNLERQINSINLSSLSSRMSQLQDEINSMI